jgi:lantibiotic modifying enzyme
LYDGTAGVGLFLTEIAVATGDADARRAAAGAMRHAASRAHSLPEVSRSGLYAGRYGIALALAYTSRLLDEPTLTEEARLLATPHSAITEGGEFDLFSGHAGAIVGLLALDDLLDDEQFGERASEHGDALLAAADHHDDGISWRSGSVASTQGLTGYSHGTAGAATALLELATASDEQRYRTAAAGAFAYERALYSAAVRNWPDLRRNAHDAPGTPSTYATLWCHGAPGIALSRIRALELGAQASAHDEAIRDDAIVALETTASWTKAVLPTGMNYSLCHGLAGNAEILLEGAELAGERGRAVAALVAHEGIENYFARGLPWPSGAHGAPTPGLFLGDAGIGRFYLRLAAPQVPSLLLARPTGFRPENLGDRKHRLSGAFL